MKGFDFKNQDSDIIIHNLLQDTDWCNDNETSSL